ncbi:MAG TPA: hypothetical protein VEA99_07550 [Gemmatimonadaceae bacterium]|nr:hypothetical protein [Gemmatimonadaceae bacterium]
MRKTEWQEGDIGSYECPRCKTLVQTRYEYRTVQLGGTQVGVPDVLVAVCLQCDHTVQIPKQSIAQLREFGAAK